jgi:hypothetical protein
VETPPGPIESLTGMLGPRLAPVGSAVIVLVFAIVMMVKREDLRNRLLRLIGQSQLNVATEAFDDATNRVSRYLRMQFLVNATFGGVMTTGLYFVGLPNALFWGVLAGVLRFVPYIGAVIGASLPTIVALAIFDDWQHPLLCIGLFLVAEPLLAYVVEPALYGTHTGVSPLAILVAAAFWTALWGPIGLVLSTPLTVCLMVIGRHVPQMGFLHILLSDEPVLSQPAQLYQRLLAMDERESRVLIDSYLHDHSLTELYDDVLIPALNMAEEDRHKGDLDETRERFLLQSMEELIAELADYTPEQRSDSDDTTPAPAAGLHPSIRVVCLPASDKADEITAAMLAQVLERERYATVAFPVVSSPPELLDALTNEPGDVVCISALPPFALISARSLSKSLRTRFPHLRIVVGLWGFSGGGARADERLGKAFAVEVVTSIGQATERISSMSESDADPGPGSNPHLPSAAA